MTDSAFKVVDELTSAIGFAGAGIAGYDYQLVVRWYLNGVGCLRLTWKKPNESAKHPWARQLLRLTTMIACSLKCAHVMI